MSLIDRHVEAARRAENIYEARCHALAAWRGSCDALDLAFRLSRRGRFMAGSPAAAGNMHSVGDCMGPELRERYHASKRLLESLFGRP